MNKRKSFLIFISVFILVGSSLMLSTPAWPSSFGDSLSLSPFWNWKTMETPHFRITFPEELAPQAQKVAQYYEQAHTVLSRELLWEPNTKTHVLLVDHTDAANGMTTAVSRFGMILYLTPPENYYSTSYYDDWVKLLVFHEYTHFLAMDATRGLYSVLRYVIGDVFLPNSLWPSWLHEGLAVYLETKYTLMGRGRSPYYRLLRRSTHTTLDRVNGNNPSFPAGETAYFHGYQLIRQAENTLPGSMGTFSLNSSQRVPYFIGGNIENITRKKWSTLWKEVQEERIEKSNQEKKIIQNEPITPYEVIDQTEFQTLGNALSPNRQWLAYSSDTLDHWQVLKLKNLKTQKTETIADKFSGIGISFFPDSSALVYSTLDRQKNYYLYSDLKIYDLNQKDSYWLTRFERAKDPHLSRDGKWITYTVASQSSNHLVVGKLKKNPNGRYSIQAKKVIYRAGLFDRISTPQWSHNQKSIFFTLKKNSTSETGESIYRFDWATQKVTPIIQDGFQNRFPTIDPQGNLYYISDRTGVDNLYCLKAPTQSTEPSSYQPLQITNFLTGVWAPQFEGFVKTKNQTLEETIPPPSSFIASVFSEKGWSLARFTTQIPIHSEKVTLPPVEAPSYQESVPSAETFPIQNYSIFPSIWPRQWAPIFLAKEEGNYFGGQILGYDAVMRHEYLFLGAYDTQIKKGDFFGYYSNRSFGPTLSASYLKQTFHISPATISTPLEFTRKSEAQISLSFPFQFTVSTLTPKMGIGMKREVLHPTLTKSRYVPTQDFTLTWDHTRSSRLSVVPEKGQSLLVGVRRYDDSEIENYKGILKTQAYAHLGNHFVLIPSVKGVWVSKKNPRFLDANSVAQGRKQTLLNPLPSDDYDQFKIRGYPYRGAMARGFFTSALDAHFPLAQIFRGVGGTFPLFFEQLSMNLFAEETTIPSFRSETKHLRSVGGGLRLSSDWLLHIPLTLAYDYHYGFNRLAGGQSDLFFSLNFTAVLPF